jgi:FixJ family two-component response regulator
MPERIHIFLVDDDSAVRDSLGLYLEMKKITVSSFPSVDSALVALSGDIKPDCIISDLRMPDRTGFDLQRELAERPEAPPLILITGHGDIAMAVESIKAGAYDFIEKPINEARLIASIEKAVYFSRLKSNANADLAEFCTRIAELSNRQREVMNLVVQGLSSKEIAKQLNTSPRTIDVHRAWIMERTGSHNIAQLVRLTTLLEYKATMKSAKDYV